MTLHQTTSVPKKGDFGSRHRDFRADNPYPRPAPDSEPTLWDAWNNGCRTCGEPFQTLISSCQNQQGDIYGFHPGRCYEQHILEYWRECCQWRDRSRHVPRGLIERRLDCARDYLLEQLTLNNRQPFAREVPAYTPTVLRDADAIDRLYYTSRAQIGTWSRTTTPTR